MRRRSPRQPSAQQMLRDYLGAVSTAATRKLPKGDRLLFVGRTRAAIEARVGPLASADADKVAAALTALGDPDELAAKERERLYSTRRRGAAAEPPTLWKPPGKTSRRFIPSAKPRSTSAGTPRGGSTGAPRGGSADAGSAGAGPAGAGPAGAPPRRSRPWPYRRSGAGEPTLPGSAGRWAGRGCGWPGLPGRPGRPGPSPRQLGPALLVLEKLVLDQLMPGRAVGCTSRRLVGPNQPSHVNHPGRRSPPA